MAKFSAFQDFSAFRFSSKAPHGETIYRAAVNAENKAFSMKKGTYEETRLYCLAMGLARAQYALERSQAQYDPLRVIALLPSKEFDWSCIPGPYDGIVDRQNELAARMKLPRGARRENVESILRTIYGDDFIAYRTILPQEVVSWPSDPWTGPGVFLREDGALLPKFLKLTSPVVAMGVSKVYYEAIQAGDPATLDIDETVCVQVENIGLAEQVKVLSVGQDSGGLYFTADFVRSHDIGASVIFGTVPVWMSNQRFSLIIVKAPAGRDLAKYRRTAFYMERVLRGVSSWAVVEPNAVDSSTCGPYTLNISRLGMTPIGTVNIVDSASGVPPLPVPDVEFVIPQQVAIAGGTVVDIYGDGLKNASAVTFGGSAATIVSNTDKKIRCTVPAHSAGDVDVVVTTPGGSGTLLQSVRYA